MNKDFFKQLFAGDKKALKVTAVTHIIVPKLDEMKMSVILAMIDGKDDAREYFPDEYWKKKTPDRTFFFNVLNTVHPGYLQQLISHANIQRVGVV